MSQLAYIPPFYLCENGKTKVFFKAPTVADYRSFCGMSADMEETVTTEYLNRMQDKENHPEAYSNSQGWTANDRRTALFWLYVHTRADTVITQSYTCNHCQQKHGRQFDLLVLMDGITTASIDMQRAVELPGKGSGRIVPLRGEAMEHLEILRNMRDEHDENSKEWALANMDMRVFEVAHCIRFAGEDEAVPYVERTQARFDYLLSLDAEKQFRPLAAAVRLTLEDMQHGLAAVYYDGSVSLVVPDHECPVIAEAREAQKDQLKQDGIPAHEWPQELQEGNTAINRLLLPFRSHHFFPEI